MARGRIAEDIREGRPVNPDDIFQASKPLMRDLAPLFDRMRVKAQKEMIDRMTGELARKYHLTPQGQDVLKQWFDKKATEDAKRWSEMVTSDGTRLVDMMNAAQNVRPDEGLDAFMPSILSGDQLAAFRAERLAERVQRVEQAADHARSQRLNAIVTLDEAQRDQVFGIMARSHREYDPAMVHGRRRRASSVRRPMAIRRRRCWMFCGRTSGPRTRPSTRAAAKRQRKDMEAMGLTLPPDWDMLGRRFPLIA